MFKERCFDFYYEKLLVELVCYLRENNLDDKR